MTLRKDSSQTNPLLGFAWHAPVARFSIGKTLYSVVPNVKSTSREVARTAMGHVVAWSNRNDVGRKTLRLTGITVDPILSPPNSRNQGHRAYWVLSAMGI